MGLFDWRTKKVSKGSSVMVCIGGWAREITTITELEDLIAEIPMHEISYYVDKYYGLCGREKVTYIIDYCQHKPNINNLPFSEHDKYISMRQLTRGEKLELKADVIEAFKNRPRTIGTIYL